MRLSRLTKAERIFLKRRRSGLTQSGMAARLKVSLAEYTAIEDGRVQIKTDIPEISAPTDGEKCCILRRRKGWTQAQVAAAYGSCKTQIQYIEQGKADSKKLMEFWKAFV